MAEFNNREQVQVVLARRDYLDDKDLEDLLVELLDAASMASQPPPPKAVVAGYTPQSDARIALVNEFKQDEERLLRKLDKLSAPPVTPMLVNGTVVPGGWLQVTPAMEVDMRWVAIARTHFQEGFMALNRAVFQPQRIKLPEDE